MMVLHDTLMYDSENWSTYQPFPVVSLFLCLGASFIGAVISVIKVYCLFFSRLIPLLLKASLSSSLLNPVRRSQTCDPSNQSSRLN